MCGIWAILGADGNNSIKEDLKACLKIAHRGPDQFRMENVNHLQNCVFGFHRLAINDDLHGMQPLKIQAFDHLCLCYNGEIYNAPIVEKEYGFKYETCCDGEAILHLYNKGGIDFMVSQLDGVFAIIFMDVAKRRIYLARDLYGVRPMFRVHTKDGILAVCSEAKGLMELKLKGDTDVEAFQPGHYEEYEIDTEGKVWLLRREQYRSIGDVPNFLTIKPAPTEVDTYQNVRHYVRAAVKKRMLSQRRIGCMLSGGLDSSLVAALVVECAKEAGLPYPIQTFSIGMEGSPDIIAARKVAKHIGSEHHEVSFTAEEAFIALEDIIFHLESYDITTIRASIGMYLISQYISKNTDSVVIFSGEGADEVAQGYIYFKKAPSAAAGDEDSRRLLSELYMYDVLRADRVTAAHGLELRVPFLDQPFTAYYMGLPAAERQPKDGVEKFLLRNAFQGQGLIPDDILWRHKEAFSDGVSSQSSSLFTLLLDHAETLVSDDQLAKASESYPHNTPPTKEAYLYRTIFEKHFPNHGSWLPYFWMPRWIEGVTDPSARTLQHYVAA